MTNIELRLWRLGLGITQGEAGALLGISPRHYRRLEAGYPITATIELLISHSVDPRDPDPTKTGIFRNHNCWKCQDGRNPCTSGNPYHCQFPHARND